MVGGTRDLDRARALYEQAASSRAGSAEAAYEAAYMLVREAGRDEDEYRRYLELATDVSRSPGKYDWQVRVLAHYELGLCHEDKAQCSDDPPAQIQQHKKKALHHYHCAAEEGSVAGIPMTCSFYQAQNRLKRIYTVRCTCSTQAYQLRKATHHARIHTFTH